MEAYKNLSLINMDGESWRDIKGFEGIYQISSLGRVKSIRFRPKIMASHLSKDGYVNITFCVNNHYSYFRVHRLVAITFLPKHNSIDSLEIDHIDGNKLNNTYTNLRWVSHCDNMRNPKTTIILKKRQCPFRGKKGKEHPRSKPIYAIDKDGNRLDFDGCRAAERNGYKFSRIQSCLHNPQKTYLGYHWHYNISSQKIGIPFATQLM